jgi:hypothetical protein
MDMNLTDTERRLLRRMREMGGWLKTPLSTDEHNTMGDLVRYKLAERVGTGAQERYQLTDTGSAEADAD